ncbi:MAG: hypothetical protein HYV97_04125 [Bdellovibrio sp.]|nr:hypothetical protein [Bdellovibrio sp.]
MSAMVSLRFLFFILAMLGLAIFLLGQVFGALPDEIDKETYYQRYLAAKEISDGKREEANQALAHLGAKESQINHHEEEIRSHHESIQANQQTISHSQSEIANHRSQLQRLSQEIPRAQTRLDNLAEERQRLQENERDLVQRLEAEKRHLQREIEELERKREELRQVERAEASAQGELRAKEGQLRQTRSDESNLIAERQQLLHELEQGARERSALENTLRGLREQDRQLKLTLEQQRQVHAQNEARLKQIEQEIAPQRQALEHARTQWEAAKQELQVAQNQQHEMERQKQNINGQLEALEGQIKQIVENLARLPERERELKSREREFQTKIANLAEQIRQGQNALEPLMATIKKNAEVIKELSQGEQTPEVQAKIRALRAENEHLQAELRTLREEVTKNRQAHAEANKALGVVQQELNSLAQEQAKLEGQKVELESRRLTLRTELQQTERNLAEAVKAVARAQQNVVREQAEVARAEQNLREGEVRRESVTREVQESAKRLQQLELDSQRAAQAVAQTEERIREMGRTIAQTEARARQIEVRLVQLRDLLAQLQNQVRELQRQVSQYAVAVQNGREQLHSVEQRVAQIQQRVQTLQNERSRLLALLEQNERVRLEVETLRAELLQERAARESAIVEFETAIRESRANISRFQNLISLRERELAQFQSELQQLRRVFAAADEAAKVVERITAEKWNSYQERYNRYQLYLAASRELGFKQGHPMGSGKARPLGEAEARRLGEINGLKYGLITAELDGRWRGLLRGKLVGDGSGHSDGLNSKEDYDQAYALGFELGRSRAEAQAQRTHVPMGYAERLQEILASVPRAHVVLSNETLKGSMSYHDEKSVVTKELLDKTDETELSEQEIAAAKEIISAINQMVDNVEQDIERYRNPRHNFSDPRVAYQGAGVIPVDFGDRDCSSVYKKIPDFLRACEESYKSGFNQGATESHWKNFVLIYPKEWRQNYDKNFAKNKNNLFLTSKEESRVIVYAEARARGVREIRAKGEEDGQRIGFTETLPGAEARAFAAGREQAQDFANTHALVRLISGNSALMIFDDSRGPIQGAELALGINLYNAGGVVLAPALGRLAITEKSHNIQMPAQSRELRELPAQHVVELRDVLSAKINPNAVPGEKFWLKGVVIVPGDGEKRELRLPIVYEGIVKVNPGIDSVVNFENKPRWRDWGFWPFKWKYRTHEVEIILTGLRDNVPAGYRLQLTAYDQEAANLINIVRAEMNTDAIGRGEKIAVKLAYQFKAKAKKKQLKLKVHVFYGDDVVSENVISLSAR